MRNLESGTNSATNLPEELFEEFDIPYKFKEPYFKKYTRNRG